MSNCAIVGINWGDEGKGRMVDLIAREYDIVCRYQGGNNAGHTIVNEYGKFALHLIPSGICLPGVVVYGCAGGVLFFPPQLVVDVVDGGAKTQVKDLFVLEMISQNRFTTAQIDKTTWSEAKLDLLMEFIRTDERAAAYRDIDWSKEYDLARNGDPTDTQSAL